MFSTGVGLFPTEPAPAIRELTLLAESLGYDNVWFGDSQNIWRESSVTMGAAAVGTSRVVLGTGVTNALTRHPSLLASTWATLHELTGGRAALGIGTGDSSLRTMGLRPLKLAELEAAIDDLRALLRGEAIRESTSGERFHLNYLDAPADVPIYVAASAPRILELSGRIADGTIVLVGVSPTFIEAALALIDKGARAAGFTREDRHIVLWTPTAICDDPVQARDLARAHVARVCIRPLPAPVDDVMQAAIERVKSSYDYYHHMDTAANHADLVPDELVDLFALAGTPEECEERLRAIADLGVDQVAIVPFELPGQSRERTIRLFADIVARLQ